MEKLCELTEELLSDMLFCGFENISAESVSRLDEISDNMNELGMTEGYRITKALCSEISAFRRGENDGKILAEYISKLEFYITHIMQSI